MSICQATETAIFYGLDKPIFHLPMPVYTNDTSVSLVKPERRQSSDADESDLSKLLPMSLYFRIFHGNRSSSLWEDSTRLPQWMKDYLRV
jgi:hypothetical protein